MEATVAAIDVGTSKICTLVGQSSEDGELYVTGVGVAPARGLHKGGIIDMAEVARSIKESVQKAERVSGHAIREAYVGVGGGHVASQIGRGAVAIGKGDRPVDRDDIERAIETAIAVAMPYDRRIIHSIPREFILDGQGGIKNPLGMLGHRLEVEVHIVTGSAMAIQNLVRCVEMNDIQVAGLYAAPLAAAKAVLTEEEKEMGVALADIGGGTIDLTIYVDHSPWDTHVVQVGGYHVTRDIAVVLQCPFSFAEGLKTRFGHAKPRSVRDDEMIEITVFGKEEVITVPRRQLCEVISARVEEMFELIQQEVRRSGFDGLLPAGIVVTGGTAALPGIRDVSAQALGLPVRVSTPRRLHGLVEAISSPAYATSVGLLMWGMEETKATWNGASHNDELQWWERLIEWLKKNFLIRGD